MGVMDIVRQRLTPAILTPNRTVVGPSWTDWYEQITTDVHESSPAKLFRTQPHLYTVVSFLARNVAQLGLHSFERVSDTDRQRASDSILARVLHSPDGSMTQYDLIYATVGDMMLYDRAYWYVAHSSETETGFMVRRIPPTWIAPQQQTPFKVNTYTVSFGNEHVEVPAEQILDFSGYHPANPLMGSPAVEALRDTLREQIEASLYRQQVWKRGGRVSAVIQRPADAPEWSDAARESFRDDWYAKYTGRGSMAGGTPILEDGMSVQRIDFNAQEQQFVEAAKLSLTTVAASFHVNPTMIGQNDGANYSNVREFRRMLYGDTLGPILAQIEARLNTFFIPMLGLDSMLYYVEFNIKEKLEGSFEEQSAALQTATGAPWMTRNEARARENLPAIEGGDELITPLNVLEGGQASPTDSGSQNRSPKQRRRVRAKGRAHSDDEGQLEEGVRKFFERQERVVRSRMGAKAAPGHKDIPDWWDQARWDSELSELLFEYATELSEKVALSTLKEIGYGPDAFNADQTLNWLQEVSERTATSINDTTLEKVKDALDAEDPQEALDNTFVAQVSRAAAVATTVATTVSSFSTVEAAKQAAGEQAEKTWRTGSNPRPEHARMNGETVPLDEKFSNGLKWPGDSAGGADEVAGCNCALEITVP